MGERIPLRRIAHARAGDKGNRSNVAIFVYEPHNYYVLLEQLTAERIKRELGSLIKGQVNVYRLPKVHGLNLVMDHALEGGVNESLNLDGHGKSWSFLILDFLVELTDNLARETK